MADPTDELFVGWAPAMPPRTARAVRRVVAGLLALAIAVPLTVVLAQAPLAPASFEFGTTRRFRGTIRTTPVAALDIARPGAIGGPGAAATSSFLLVAPGKHGAAQLLQEYDGAPVELAGSLVYRGGHTMIEVVPGSIVPVASRDAAATSHEVVDLGAVRLRGEIVDAKCHLGVMNPGDGKTHRGCAARCISGGVPPALRARDAAGEESLYLLVGTRGEPIGRSVLPLVAEPVEVEGRAERRGDLLLLYASPQTIRRLDEED